MTFPSSGINQRPARVAETEHLCTFIKGLARGIIDGASHQVKSALFLRVEEMRMSP